MCCVVLCGEADEARFGDELPMNMMRVHAWK